MTDDPDLTFGIDGDAGPYLMVRSALLARVEQWLLDHRIPIRTGEGAISLGDHEVIDVVNFGVMTRAGDVLRPVRTLAAELDLTLEEPSLEATLHVFAQPVRNNEFGVGLVGGSRVTLASVVSAFRTGADAAEIAHRFPSLALADVYAAIAFYLTHRERVDAALGRLDAEAELIRAKIETSAGQVALTRIYRGHVGSQAGEADASTLVR